MGTPMRTPHVVVFDYGFGNVHSALRGLEEAGADVELTKDHVAAESADGLVVPGVGAFGAVMEGFNAAGGPRILVHRLAGGLPVLGVCVGMQIMFERSDEFNTSVEGLGEFPGIVQQLPAKRLPHMGWNTVRVDGDSRLFAGIADERFYFVHSYAALNWDADEHPTIPNPVLTWGDHEGPFLAAVEQGPLSATQFHPEKSGRAGIQLLRNWLATLPETR